MQIEMFRRQLLGRGCWSARPSALWGEESDTRARKAVALVRRGRHRPPVGAAGIVPQPPIVDRAGGPSRKYRINDDTGRSGQGLGSWLCAVHLKNVCGDIHGGVVIHALKLEEWITGGNLKPGYDFGGGFLSPTAEEDFPSQRGDVIGSSNELLIGSRQLCDGWKLTVFTLAPEQGVGMAFPATIFVCCAAGLSLSSGEDN